MNPSNLQYIKQIKLNDCGAAAIANACAWADKPLNYSKRHTYLTKELGIDIDGGVYPEVMEDFIEDHPLPFHITNVIERPNVRQLNYNLKKNRAVILFFKRKNYRHVCLITEQCPYYFSVVNYGLKYDVLTKVNKSYLNSDVNMVAIVIERNI